MKSLIKTIALGIATALLFGVFAVIFFIGAFPKDPTEAPGYNQEEIMQHAKERAKGIAEWQKEEMEETSSINPQCHESIASPKEYVAKDLSQSYTQFEDETVEYDETPHCDNGANGKE